jgi:hypothetical protein
MLAAQTFWNLRPVVSASSIAQREIFSIKEDSKKNWLNIVVRFLMPACLSAEVRDLLSYEHIIHQDSTMSFCEVLQNFHDNGAKIFSELGAMVSYFAETKNGISLIESNEACDESLLSMEVMGTLARLRDDKSAQPEVRILFSEVDDPINQDIDFRYLFANDQQDNEGVTWNWYEGLKQHEIDVL